MSASFVVEYLDPQVLTAHPANFRRHPSSQIAALRESISEHGWLAAPIVNRRDGSLRILDGHARVELALEREEATVPCRVINVDAAQEQRILASFDRIGSLAERDDQALASLLQELAESEAGLPAGWGEDDLAALLAELGPVTGGLVEGADPDAIPEAVETRCQAGELWALGEHRLLCADCTDPANVERLTGGRDRAHVLLTDPPYAVDYVEKARDMHRRGYGHSRGTLAVAIQGDGIEAGQEVGLWREALVAAYESGVREDAAVYIWHAQGRAMLLLYTLLQEMGFLHHQTLIWVKNNFVIGRCDYQWQHEPCFYGWKQGHRPLFYGEKNQTTIWDVARDTQHPDHPTQKPVAIFTPAVLNHTRPTEAVYDPFAGSGTTIIACEQAGRVARCMEISAAYCSLIVTRWEQATGREAELLEPA